MPLDLLVSCHRSRLDPHTGQQKIHVAPSCVVLRKLYATYRRRGYCGPLCSRSPPARPHHHRPHHHRETYYAICFVDVNQCSGEHFTSTKRRAIAPQAQFSCRERTSRGDAVFVGRTTPPPPRSMRGRVGGRTWQIPGSCEPGVKQVHLASRPRHATTTKRATLSPQARIG